MKEVNVELPLAKDRGYKIHVGTGLIKKVGSLYDTGKYSKVFVVTDDTIPASFLEELVSSLPPGAKSIKLPAGDKNKDIAAVQRIWTALHEAGCDRKSLLINLGGGMIGDIGGFAASTYMRGIDFLNVPTTLLAQADASVGGKTGFNYLGVKNLIGTFGQPIGVIADTLLLDALPDREFVSGFGEIIKHGAICDESHFNKATSKRPREFSEEELTDIIARSCRIKADMVQGDETENGSRKLLNFGHTVGHAVEALSLETNDPLLHGEAVSIGMAAEADLSVRLGLLPAKDLERIREALAQAGLPLNAGGISMEDALGKMRSDKKNEGGKFNFTLLEGIGRACYDQEVSEALLKEALQAIIDR